MLSDIGRDALGRAIPPGNPKTRRMRGIAGDTAVSGRDGTGPLGQGPMTGKGLEFCVLRRD